MNINGGGDQGDHTLVMIHARIVGNSSFDWDRLPFILCGVVNYSCFRY